ncbi:hypothetical protein [Desulfothermobacter acidiphilus]|uniref:hypothetical protein n=1 Tax=Desulfothermobacter acidiphilus TaxID=1938353 RepID=UPI003F8CD4BD
MGGIMVVIGPQETVFDVVATFPQTIKVFREYEARTGVCICCTALFESLEEVARHLELPLDEMLEKLNAAVREGFPE